MDVVSFSQKIEETTSPPCGRGRSKAPGEGKITERSVILNLFQDLIFIQMITNPINKYANPLEIAAKLTLLAMTKLQQKPVITRRAEARRGDLMESKLFMRFGMRSRIKPGMTNLRLGSFTLSSYAQTYKGIGNGYGGLKRI